MKLKKVKVLLTATLVLLSALSISLFAFATEGEDDFVINEITTQPTTATPTEVPTEVPTEAPTTAVPTTAAPTTARPTTTNSYRPSYTSSYTQSSTTNSNTEFTIKLELNNEEEPIEISVDKNGLVTVPQAPEKEGFKFDGWYSDEELTEKWDFLTSKATEETVLYAKWVSLQDADLFSITVSTNLGGVVTVEPTRAQEGEIVTITVKPNKGSQLVENSLSVNGKFIDGYSFEMPANNVIVEAQFETIEDVAAEENDKGLKDKIGKIVTIAAIAIVVIAVVVWLIVNRYRFMPEEEEDELFFVEPMTNQPAIRHDDFVRNKRNQIAKQQNQNADALDIINEDKIRKINKTGNINLDQ